MVEVRPCSVLLFGSFKELPALAAEYEHESAIAGMPRVRIDEANYLRQERAGVLHMATATLDGALIGFILLLVNTNMHYSVKIGVVESFFVAAAHRKTGAGLMLRRWAEECARQLGAVGFFLSAPVGSRLAAVMEKDKAYEETNRVFFRSLV